MTSIRGNWTHLQIGDSLPSDPSRANIVCTREEIWRGRAVCRFRWDGDPAAPVRVDFDTLRAFFGAEHKDIPQTLPPGPFPWPMRLVRANEWYESSGEYVRTDTTRGWLAWAYYAARHRISEAVAPVFARCILTLMVWNLAYVAPNERVTWRAIGRKRP